MTIEGGPYLAFATVCEKVLQEKDETLSLIRMVDRVTVNIPSPDVFAAGAHLNLPIVVAIGFKSGEFRGTRELDLRLHTPGGEIVRTEGTPLPIRVFFRGEETGANFIMTLMLDASSEGLYWIDVLLDGAVVTRLPLRIAHQSDEPQPPMQTAPGWRDS
jgi:hypothetical protein